MGTGTPLWRHSWLASDRPVARLIARPLRTFLDTEAAGGLVLLGATVIALGWANSPLGDSYESWWTTELSISFGSFSLAEDLRHWVNDALMTLFFFVVGLEIKRELVVGELNDVRKAALPAVAAVGGMIVPGAIYALFNAGGAGSAGWGIPMATDIAFAVGILALLGSRVPPGLKVFLLSLAIVDDIGAILLIALFYSDGISMAWLAGASIGLVTIVALRRMRVFWVPAYVLVGTGVWLATLESGIHATIAGVALGLLTPARPSDPGGFEDVIEDAAALPAEPDAESVRALTMQSQEVVSVADRLVHTLHPWTSYAIVPLFALANAGVILSLDALRDAASSTVTLGVVGGLVVGKGVGIAVTAWVAVRFGWGALPTGVGWRDIAGVSLVAGVGFTVSLFVTGLAFSDPGLVDAAKIGVLAGSLLAGLTGATLLATSRPSLGDVQAAAHEM